MKFSNFEFRKKKRDTQKVLKFIHTHEATTKKGKQKQKENPFFRRRKKTHTELDLHSTCALDKLVRGDEFYQCT